MPITEAMEARGLTDATVAEAISVSAEAVRLWRRGKRTLPAERAVEIEAKLGIPRHEMRPDLWSAPRGVEAA